MLKSKNLEHIQCLTIAETNIDEGKLIINGAPDYEQMGIQFNIKASLASDDNKPLSLADA